MSGGEWQIEHSSEASSGGPAARKGRECSRQQQSLEPDEASGRPGEVTGHIF